MSILNRLTIGIVGFGITACSQQMDETDIKIPTSISALETAPSDNGARTNQSSETAALTARENPEDYTALMDTAKNNIILSPSREVRVAALEVETFIDAVQEQQPAVDAVGAFAKLRSEGVESILQGDCELRLRPSSGQVLFRDLRGTKTDRAITAADEPTDRSLEASTKALMSALDPASQGEDQTYAVRTVGSDGIDRDGQFLGRKRVAKKVFVYRNIGGIPVDGQKLVFTYALDGDLRKVLGQWNQIYLTGGKLSSNLSEKEVIQRALQTVAAKIPTKVIDNLYVTTRYKTVDGTIKLTGYVTVAQGPGRQAVVLEFDL